MAEGSARRRARMAAIVDDECPVDDHVVDPFRIAARIVDRGQASDPDRVEYDHVGEEPIAQAAAIRDPESGGRRRGHLADRLFEAEQALVTDELAQDPGKRTVGSRAGLVAYEHGIGA